MAAKEINTARLLCLEDLDDLIDSDFFEVVEELDIDRKQASLKQERDSWLVEYAAELTQRKYYTKF